jgi:hypothetical protein
MEHLRITEICANLTQIEKPSIGLYDLTLEHQVQYLEYMKRYKDIEHGKPKGRGFANCQQFNHKRNPRVFTTLEREFHKLAKDFDLELNHEVRIKVNDRFNRQHIFKLDFLDPKTRINVEISPDWHRNYLLVARRDALRRQLLKKVGIRSLTVRVTKKCNQLHIDYIRARRIIKTIKSATISPNSLDYYGGE